MYPSLRLLAARLPPFSVTGLTGVLTHPSPRPTLIALYNHTLTLLSQLPSNSVYRHSTENLTRHRLNLIEAATPAGHETYQQELEAAKQRAGVSDRKDSAFELSLAVTQARILLEELATSNKDRAIHEYYASAVAKWDFPGSLAPSSAEAVLGGAPDGAPGDLPVFPSIGGVPFLPVEPELTVEQVDELEEKFGGGLIEEVIDQGWAELNLVADMESAKVWEGLEVVPEEGQWVGFERK